MGKLISFIGMDGSGKSTMVKVLRDALLKKGYKAKIIYAGRGRSNILPMHFFGKVYKKAGGKASNEPGKKFEKISLIHTLGAPVFALDLLLRYIFVILPALFSHDFVITDRYSTDILLMNKVPRWLKKVLYFFLPRPNRIFYLYNTVSILHRRKPEHPLADLKRQEQIFAQLTKDVNATKIKTTQVQKDLKKILRYIL